jgi:hypothetical protein
MRWAGHVACMETITNRTFKKHEGKRPHGRPMIIQKDNIKMDLKK